MIRYILNLAVTASQAANAILLAGHPDETISARCYTNRTRRGWSVAYRVVNFLFFLQEDHCRDAWEYDVMRAFHIIAKESLVREP